jgi:hypothetical protein
LPGVGGGAGATALRDCLPTCVSSRRQACERPPIDAGACLVGGTSAGEILCYANGVHEIHSAIDGGQLVTITTPDGQTVCYQVVVESSGNQHYETAAGQEFASLKPAPDGGYAVSCDGATVVVDINDPACATQNGANCQSGTCP